MHKGCGGSVSWGAPQHSEGLSGEQDSLCDQECEAQHWSIKSFMLALGIATLLFGHQLLSLLSQTGLLTVFYDLPCPRSRPLWRPECIWPQLGLFFVCGWTGQRRGLGSPVCQQIPSAQHLWNAVCPHGHVAAGVPGVGVSRKQAGPKAWWAQICCWGCSSSWCVFKTSLHTLQRGRVAPDSTLSTDLRSLSFEAVGIWVWGLLFRGNIFS